MGNSASNASTPPNRVSRGRSPVPACAGDLHPSLRTEQKSLELPDLASLSLDHTNGRQAKTASIRAPCHRLSSTADANLGVPCPPAPRLNPTSPRGRQQPVFPGQQQQQVAYMQELCNQSQQHSPSRQLSFQQETVRSSIPAKALSNQLLWEEIVQQECTQKGNLLADFVPVKMVWNGGGTQVVLAHAGDEEWKGLQVMEKESANVWTSTVMLPPGTHHIRFLVDGQWRVADDLPAAVDDQGSLANYVAVPIPVLSTPAPTSVTCEKLVSGQSFWSADSSAPGKYQLQQQQTHPHTTHSHSAHWTNVLPPELIEAAREEEAYLAASAGQYEVSSSNTRVTTGFVPAPNIPPAPGLPRHLEKLILNTRIGMDAAGTESASGAVGAGTRPGSGQMGNVGSVRAARKERRDRERDGDRERRDCDKRECDKGRERDGDGDRDRDRERGERRTTKRAAGLNIPLPLPPPSEDGLVLPSTDIPVSSLIGATGVESISLNTSTAIFANTSTTTTPQTSLPSTPTEHMSSTWLCSSEGGTGNEPPATIVPIRSLNTSAIRNGVLAVGNTVRYKKYITTIYYKPT